MFEGILVANASYFPYVLLIITNVGNASYKECTALAIENNIAVTAAHCFLEKESDKETFSPSKILLSSFVREGNFRDHEVLDVYFHPLHKLLQNDIALVKTNGTFNLKLPLMPYKPFVGTDSCMIIGYGPNNSLNKPKTLRAPSVLGVLPLPQNYCRSLQSYETSHICVPLENGLGPCHGDSGGPMICSGTAVGILSRGLVWGEVGCGKPLYSVLFFEDLFYHRGWINSMVRKPITINKSHKIFVKTFTIYIFFLLLIE